MVHIKLTPQDIIVNFKLISHTFSLLVLHATYSFHKKETYNPKQRFSISTGQTKENIFRLID